MSDHIDSARHAVRSAAESTEKSQVREQLESIDEGLEGLSGTDAPDESAVQGDRLEEIESKLVGLETADDRTTAHLESARDHLDAYRRQYAQDW